MSEVGCPVIHIYRERGQVGNWDFHSEIIAGDGTRGVLIGQLLSFTL